MSAPAYSITLHHLSPDAKAAGLAYPDEHLLAVSIGQLRELLFSLSEVAARQTIYEPSSPEIRIKTDRDVFVVRTRYRRLCFIGWEAILRGEEHSVVYILAAITGSSEHGKTIPKIERQAPSYKPQSAPSMDAGGLPRWVKVTVLMVLIIGFNVTAVWLLLRPPPSLAPKFTLLPDFESRALLTKVAGQYSSGNREGDRRLIIEPEGILRFTKLGPKKTMLDESTKPVRGGLAEGRAALITSDPPAVLAIKDADTVVIYGTTYHRNAP
jgi:hypothetical protein